jgi:hypothetical protein
MLMTAATLSVGQAVLLESTICCGGGPPPVPCSSVRSDSFTTGLPTGISGNTLTATVQILVSGHWKEMPTVTDVAGGTLVGVSLEPYSPDVSVQIALSATPANGSFTLRGTWEGTDCPVVRKFTFSIGDAGEVILAELAGPGHDACG